MNFSIDVRSHSPPIIEPPITANRFRRFTAVSRFPECDPIYDNDPCPDTCYKVRRPWSLNVHTCWPRSFYWQFSIRDDWERSTILLRFTYFLPRDILAWVTPAVFTFYRLYWKLIKLTLIYIFQLILVTRIHMLFILLV